MEFFSCGEKAISYLFDFAAQIRAQAPGEDFAQQIAKTGMIGRIPKQKRGRSIRRQKVPERFSPKTLVAQG
ncbi:MAG: hypothetical protein JO340_15895 [Acidobacteriaceae bacterium]|nr:hypothetical protein [Acidobacteriaceae bacterium]